MFLTKGFQFTDSYIARQLCAVSLAYQIIKKWQVSKKLTVSEFSPHYGVHAIQRCLMLTKLMVVVCLFRSSVVSGRKMQVGSGSGNFRKSRVGSVRVESGNANKNYIKFYNGDINKRR